MNGCTAANVIGLVPMTATFITGFIVCLVLGTTLRVMTGSVTQISRLPLAIENKELRDENAALRRMLSVEDGDNK
ncbi:hypothetical protein [Nocardiopsis lambiniae]|uniref:DUF1049 domain-containing protein n=1 Tax=Nocardiopsis lambiniae TaxID=3075539 RepID=A0ABU2MDY0_9ACTN|nr:hypothetical protein [Nocardiopsis sp. DSM 44743]MDT0330887.1 hypothetical protein [Nocardiopsis sp. DSM 44743]